MLLFHVIRLLLQSLFKNFPVFEISRREPPFHIFFFFHRFGLVSSSFRIKTMNIKHIHSFNPKTNFLKTALNQTCEKKNERGNTSVKML